jgi:hypothetical protein
MCGKGMDMETFLTIVLIVGIYLIGVGVAFVISKRFTATVSFDKKTLEITEGITTTVSKGETVECIGGDAIMTAKSQQLFAVVLPKNVVVDARYEFTPDWEDTVLKHNVPYLPRGAWTCHIPVPKGTHWYTFYGRSPIGLTFEIWNRINMPLVIITPKIIYSENGLKREAFGWITVELGMILLILQFAAQWCLKAL